jgi:DNA-binding NarL/FixJ family response regulator
MFAEGHRALGVIALARLADLRIKQGRIEEAAQLLQGYEDHPLAVRPAVRLRVLQGQAPLATRMLRNRLEQVGAASLLAAPLLALLVEAQLVIGNVDSATQTAQNLMGLAQLSGQPSVTAEAELALGAVLLAARSVPAVDHLERAAVLFTSIEQPLEASRARLLAGRARVETDRQVALADIRAALATFQRLGARRDFDEAAALLRQLGEAGPRGPRGARELTQREEEVLRLLGGGLSNAEIGQRLFISPKTAEHHVGRVLDKLELRSRAEAAAYATRHYASTSGEK